MVPDINISKARVLQWLKYSKNRTKYVFYRFYQKFFCRGRLNLISDGLNGLADFETSINGTEIKVSNPIYLLEVPDVRYRLSNYSITKGDVIIDAGAYPGEFTIYAAKKVGEEGKVIAFEPDPMNFKKLKENIQLNNLGNVVLLNKGLWNLNGTLDLVSRGPSSHFKTNSLAEDGKEEAVDVVTLDNELERLGISKVDFIKMDIEGAEIEALEGMEKILKQHKPHLAIASYHIRNGEKTRWKVEDTLKTHDYKTKTPEPPIGRELVTFGYRSPK